jgi:uncharacterized protein (DUF433 family)
MNTINFEEKFEAGKKDVLYFEVLLKGRDISVREILRQLSLGKSTDEVLESNPGMTISDIHDCLRYAWELVGVIDFKKAMTAVNNSITKRHDLANRIRAVANKMDDDKKFSDF